MKKNVVLITIALMILTVGTVLAVGPGTNPNKNWGTKAGSASGSVGHINPAYPNQNFGEIYPGPDDCGFLNGGATQGSQQALPDAVPFEQAFPPT